jgi:hypothetical protein
MYAGSEDEGDAGEAAQGSERRPAGAFSDAEALQFLLQHKESVAEVKALCGDLQVLPSALCTCTCTCAPTRMCTRQKTQFRLSSNTRTCTCTCTRTCFHNPKKVG